MRVAYFPTRILLFVSGCLVCMFLLLTAVPVAARQASDDSANAPAKSAKAHKRKKPAGSAKPAKPGKAGGVEKPAAAGKTGSKTAKARKFASAGKSARSDMPDSAEKPAVVGKPARGGKKARKSATRPSKAAGRARAAKIKLAFVASTELRPMAQQLATLRTPAAYVGVSNYARAHKGEAAAAAYLALGHAYLLDKRYTDAEASLRQARQAGEELADYADFLAARAYHEAGRESEAEALFHGFAERYPDSIFADQVPEHEANVLIAIGDFSGAQKVLAAAAETDAASHPGYQLALGQVAFALGRMQEAQRIYKKLLLGHPMSQEAEVARARLTSMGAETSLTTAELRSLGDAYYNAGRYADAGEQYRALTLKSGLDAGSRNAFAVAAAACDLKLKRLTTAQVEALADSPDESGARRLYLLMELARNRNDLDDQRQRVAELEARFPQSPWLEEALFSSGNMYLLRREYSTAAQYYSYLATHFPSGKRSATAHWRAGWLSYRQGLYTDAAHLFDEQIKLYPTATETASALYWRGRLYEMQDHKPAQAAASYRTVVRAYQHFFYAQMAKARLAALGDTQIEAPPQLDSFQPPVVPVLQESFPTDSPHLAKARLLANAGLNDYIAQEIAADPDSSSWSALAEAQIYASYGETFRAMRSLKRALPYAASAPIKSVPLAYWRILFPEPWWSTITAEAAKNNLDPYLVASLIRQESEFNPSAVSNKSAYGLMQLLPSVGKSLAREEGMSHFETFQLLDPATNIRLGTRYLRKTLDRFGGVTEYALAAYNAGDSRVADWQAAGPYQGIDEFVESIPFSETRDYVESILRNAETYREIDTAAGSQVKGATGAGR